MRIGISVLTQSGQNIWSNGLTQNVIFLAQSLKSVPFVSSVVLLNAGDQPSMPEGVDLDKIGVTLVPTQQAGDLIDVVLEMAGGIDVQWLDLMRARGKRVVWYCAGQPYVGLIEPSVFNRPGYAVRHDRMDEIWVLPKDGPAFSPMLRALHRCPVHQVPYLWSAQFLQQRIAQVEAAGAVFGYQDRAVGVDGLKAPLSVALFEPNISVVKASSLPMLICDEAYRADPRRIGFMSALNTLHMKDHNTLLYLANSLNLVKDKKAVFLGRHDFAGFMAQGSNAVVAHQWQNDQNYAYLDALYGNYPLIHNSPWIKDLGYYYPDFDTIEGARQLLIAHQDHDSVRRHQQSQVQALFANLSPTDTANVQAYGQRLQALSRGTSFEVAQ